MMEEQEFYQAVYEMCQEMIDPHLIVDSDGCYSVTQDSLIPSVVESMEYLVQFWLANKDKPNIDLCL